MTRKSLDELTAGHALGTLDAAEASQLEALAAHDPEAQSNLSAFIDTAAAFATAASPLVAPPAALRGRILDALSAEPQTASAPAVVTPQPGFSFILKSEQDWVDTGVAGFRIKFLSGGPDTAQQVILAELGPGGKVPEHDHTADEGLFLVSGHLQTAHRLLGPGDFLRAEAGTHHEELVSPNGCVALLVFSPSVAG